MGGSGSSGSSQPKLPKEVLSLMRTVVPQQQKALERSPIWSFTDANPLQIANFTDEQQQALTGLQGLYGGRMGSDALQAPEALSLKYFTDTLGGTPGDSPAVSAMMDAWERNVRPAVQNEAAMAGLATSGAYLDSLAKSRSEALVPVLLDDMARRERAAGALPAFGQLMESRPVERAQGLFDTGEQERQVAQQEFDAIFQDFLRRQGLVENIGNVTTGSIVPSSIGARTSQDTKGSGLLGLFTGGHK